MKTKLILPLAIALAVVTGPMAAQAACEITGKLVRVKMKDDSQKGKHLLYVKENALDTFHYTVKTGDDNLAEAAATLAALQARILVKGSTSACPDTSAATPGQAFGIGKVIELVAVP